MKRTAILLILLSLGFVQSYAQKGDNKATQNKVQAARIGLITERLNLTPEQAEKFWPLYKEFITKRNSIKAEYNAAKKGLNPETATEEQRRELLDLSIKLKERSLDLERNYSDRMLRVISAQQVMALRKAEDDFRKLVREQIQRRRQAQQQRRDRVRDRANDRVEKRKNN